MQKIIEDGEVETGEFYELKIWMEKHRDLQGNYPFDRVFNALDNILEDGKVTDEELDELQILFSYFVDPVKNQKCHEDITSIFDKHICVTGDFAYGSRNDVFSLIEEAGGIVDKNVKKSTDYLVVGSNGSENWKTVNYGSKIQKAMEMIANGADIKIIEEADFIHDLKRNVDSGGVVEENIFGEGSIIGNIDWKQSLRDMLNDLVMEYELPVGSLYLSDNYGQKGKKKGELISHTVCIWEPAYPPVIFEKPGQNKLVLTLAMNSAKSRADDIDLAIRETQEMDLRRFLPDDAEMLPRTKSDLETGTVRIRFKKSSSGLVEYIKQNTIYCIKGYESKATRFGCCSNFEKCSDAKKCVHENKLYSKACMYRDNLEQGKIFYGKNRNID